MRRAPEAEGLRGGAPAERRVRRRVVWVTRWVLSAFEDSRVVRAEEMRPFARARSLVSCQNCREAARATLGSGSRVRLMSRSTSSMRSNPASWQAIPNPSRSKNVSMTSELSRVERACLREMGSGGEMGWTPTAGRKECRPVPGSVGPGGEGSRRLRVCGGGGGIG